MTRKRAITLVVAGVGLLGTVLLALAMQARRPPSFYSRALSVAPEAEQAGSDELLAQAGALVSAVAAPGRWEAEFTAEQLNGWLAVDVPRNHPQLVPAGMAAPRVALEPGRAWLGCRYDQAGLSTYLSLELDVYLAAEDTLAIRVRGARSGLLPLPLGGVLETISETATLADLRLRWTSEAGDPVALVSLPASAGEHGKRRIVEAIEVRSDVLYIAGRTESHEEPFDPDRANSVAAQPDLSNTRHE